MSVHEAANLLSNTLYQRRFFPYYTFSLLTGVDSNGIGAVYRYDAVGSFERVRAACAGKGEKLIQPFLDEIANLDADDALWAEFQGIPPAATFTAALDPHFAANILRGASCAANAHPVEIDSSKSNDIAECSPKPFLDISEEAACQLVVKCFLAASEREISVGDGLEIWIQRHNDDDDDTSCKYETKARVSPLGRVSWRKQSRIVLEKKFYALPQH